MHADERTKIMLDVISPLRDILATLSAEAKQLLVEELVKLLPELKAAPKSARG